MTTLRAACWNLRVGRPVDRVVDEVLTLLDEFDIDVLTVCEAVGYVKPLSRVLRRHGYRLVWFPRGDDSARDSAVIVRRGLRVRGKRLHRLERTGWERKPGRPGLHWPRSAVSVSVEGIRFLAVHQPPGPFGYPLRRAANETGFATVTRLGRRWRRPWVMPGDWNRLSSDPVARAFLDATGATAQGKGIDWIAARGVQLSHVREHEYGNSDHDPKTFTVSR